MRIFLEKNPINIILIPFFFSVHKLNEYFELIPAISFVSLLAFGIGLSFAFFFIGMLLYKNTSKAGYWTAILLILFFFFGFGRHLLRASGIPAFFTSYKFLLSFILFFTIWLTYSIRKRNTAPLQATLFLNVIFLIFVFFEIGSLVFKKITNQGKENDLAYKNPKLDLRLQNPDMALRPDIFFIVFDEYASSASLRKYLNFDNQAVDSAFANHLFYVSKRSQANYNSTPHSIASTLNLDYFNLPVEKQLTDLKNMSLAKYSLEQSLLPKVLAAGGYKIVNKGLFDLDKHPVNSDIFFSISFLHNMLSETLWGRIRNEVWWNVVIRFPKLADNEKEETETIARNISNYQGVLSELGKQDSQPKFVLGHLLLPHGAFLVNRKGERRRTTFNDIGPWRDSLYLDQLIYANTLIDTLLKASVQQFQRPRVIIIEGDHGYRESRYDRIFSREKEFMNLNAYYFSDHNYTGLYDSISPVNSFRVVLNKYFGNELPLLKDSTVFLY